MQKDVLGVWSQKIILEMFLLWFMKAITVIGGRLSLRKQLKLIPYFNLLAYLYFCTPGAYFALFDRFIIVTFKLVAMLHRWIYFRRLQIGCISYE